MTWNVRKFERDFFPSYGLNLYYTIADNNADIRHATRINYS